MVDVILPKDFKARYSKLLGDENKAFLECCSRRLRKALRVNTLKISPDELIPRLEKQGYLLKEIPWMQDQEGRHIGYWITGRKNTDVALGNTEEHFLGYFYIQEASSMIPPLVLEPEAGDRVLDVAAAPGSKTTQMSAMMENQGMIVANDPNISRLRALVNNIEKMGALNVVVSRMNGLGFGRTKNKFDKILLDAPCSAEGTVRKDWKALSKWSVSLVKNLSNLQKGLILSAADCLEDGGTLVYSTCTLAPEENEEVISHLLRSREGFEVLPVELRGLRSRPGITDWEGKEYSREVKKCARVYPQDNDSEGFFICKLKKKEAR